MRKKLFSVLLISLIIIITSCSVVFRGGLGGVVNDSDNNPISEMKVWVYLDKEARDTDYNTYSSDPESVQESSMIKGSAITDENGNFNINAIIWNSSSPIFGKTADLREVYLLFYHELFGLQKNRFAVRIYSDATNSGAVNEIFSSVKERSNLSLTIENVATYTQLNQTVTATIKVYKSDDTLIETIKKNITGSDTIEITKDIEEEVKVSVALSKELSSWTQCDEDGNALPAILPTTTFSSTSPAITLYMKNSRLTLPSLNGIYRSEIYVDADDIENGTYTDDNVVLLLCERQGDTFIPFDSPNARIVTDKRITGTNTPITEHGLFDGLGSGIEFTDTTYTGRYTTKTVYIVVVDNDVVPASGHDYFQITVNSNETNKHVGLLMTPTDTIP